MNINFHLRNPKEKQRAQSIWAVFYYNNHRYRIDTGLSLFPYEWSRAKQKPLACVKESDQITALLNDMSDFVADYMARLALKRERFYRDVLQEEFNRSFKIGDIKPKTRGEIVDFISFIDYYIDSKKHLAEGTLQTLRGARKSILLAFGLVPEKLVREWNKMNVRERKFSNLLQPDKILDFDQIDYNWMQHYHSVLLNSKYLVKRNGVDLKVSYKKNNIAKAIKLAKQFANAAVDAGYIKNLSFRGLKAAWEEADTIHLTWDEIKALKELDLDPTTTAGKVRNLFVLNCYCGLRLSDLNRLDKNSFIRQQGQLFIKIRMQKTDETLMFPILKSAEEIMAVYEYNLPSISEPIFNETIKKLCLRAGITQLEQKRETKGGTKLVQTLPKYQMVSSHTGRRSFATNFEEDGVPLKELMAITGHTTEKAFRKYVKKKTETKFSGFLAIGANR